MKKFSVFIIIIGLLVASYPLLEQAFTWYWQQKLFKEWENIPIVEEQPEVEIILAEEDEEEEENTAFLSPTGPVLGILKISKINLRVPVIQGLNETNLKIGISYLEDSAKIGEKGNTVLAGHRGRSYGRLFNRLNEMEVDDQIVISTDQGDYTYLVYKTVIVEPNDVSVLRTGREEKILTLVTCEPIRNPTHRLIVQAKQVN
ncbi:MAG: class D sortase [Bacillota bacterium]